MLSIVAMLALGFGTQSTSQLHVTFQDMPDVAQVDFEKAADIWEGCLVSDAPVHIHVRWIPNGPTGFAYHALIRNKRYLPNQDVWYPTALAGALYGQRVTDADDINIFLRSDVDWYFSGYGQITDDKIDFINVAVHEIAHGLGVSSGSFVPWQGDRIAQIGYPNEFLDFFEWTFELPALDGTPLIYDTMLGLADGRQITRDFENPSTELAKALDNPTIHFTGASAIAANGGFPVGVTPGNVSHIPASIGRPTPIMLGDSGQGETIHQPDPILLGMLEDIGWEITPVCQANARAAQMR